MGAAIVALIAGLGTYVLKGGGGTPANAPISPGVPLPGPGRVGSMRPTPGARRAGGSDPVQVTFSARVAAGSPRPSVAPGVPGSWQAAGDTLMFTPTVPFSPSTRVTVSVPGGQAGVRSARGSLLAKPMTAQFTTEPFSSLALADLLGQLGYLPASWQQPNPGMRITTKFPRTDAGPPGAPPLAPRPPPPTTA